MKKLFLFSLALIAFSFIGQNSVLMGAEKNEQLQSQQSKNPDPYEAGKKYSWRFFVSINKDDNTVANLCIIDQTTNNTVITEKCAKQTADKRSKDNLIFIHYNKSRTDQKSVADAILLHVWPPKCGIHNIKVNDTYTITIKFDEYQDKSRAWDIFKRGVDQLITNQLIEDGLFYSPAPQVTPPSKPVVFPNTEKKETDKIDAQNKLYSYLSVSNAMRLGVLCAALYAGYKAYNYFNFSIFSAMPNLFGQKA